MSSFFNLVVDPQGRCACLTVTAAPGDVAIGETDFEYPRSQENAFIVSPDQARQLAKVLLATANEADEMAAWVNENFPNHGGREVGP